MFQIITYARSWGKQLGLTKNQNKMNNTIAMEKVAAMEKDLAVLKNEILKGTTRKGSNAMEWLKTWEDAAEYKSIDPVRSLPYPKPDSLFEEAINATFKLWIIQDILNDGWMADYSNENEYKYYPWFRFNGSAFVFVGSDCDGSVTGAGCGPRLCLKTRELSNYFGQQFIELHNQVLIK